MDDSSTYDESNYCHADPTHLLARIPWTSQILMGAQGLVKACATCRDKYIADNLTQIRGENSSSL
jgi:hypothetical protein